MSYEKREGVLLAQEYLATKHSIGGQLMSEKLDGERVWWDGGFTRGMSINSVPFAFKPKYGRLATGLWTRNFKPVYAPESFIKRLPIGIMLDGEVWGGVGKFQETMSCVRKETPVESEWEKMKYCVFDSPCPSQVFKTGYMRIQKDNHIINCSEWAKRYITLPNFTSNYESRSKLIPSELAHPQERLPLREEDAIERMLQRLEEVTSIGGEGLMIRKLVSYWMPHRSNDLLKIKKYSDAEGTVVGYEEGKGKLEGMMGTLVLEGNVPIKLGSDITAFKRFKISGFTEDERKAAQTLYPLGLVVSYRYTDITQSGEPRFARFWRKREQSV